MYGNVSTYELSPHRGWRDPIVNTTAMKWCQIRYVLHSLFKKFSYKVKFPKLKILTVKRRNTVNTKLALLKNIGQGISKAALAFKMVHVMIVTSAAVKLDRSLLRVRRRKCPIL